MCGVIAVHVQESTLFFSQTVRDLVCLLFNFDSKIWVCSWVVNHALVMKLTYFRWLEQVFWKFSVQLSLHLDNIVKFVHEVFIEIFPWTWTMNMNTLTQRMCIGTFVPQIWQIEKVHVPSTWSKNYKVQLLRTFVTETNQNQGRFAFTYGKVRWVMFCSSMTCLSVFLSYHHIDDIDQSSTHTSTWPESCISTSPHATFDEILGR